MKENVASSGKFRLVENGLNKVNESSNSTLSLFLVNFTDGMSFTFILLIWIPRYQLETHLDLEFHYFYKLQQIFEVGS